jgi:hypothetical protein
MRMAANNTVRVEPTYGGPDRKSPESIQSAVAKGGRIRRETLDRLLELLPKKTDFLHWIALEVRTPALLKTIDNEDDALETIRRLEGAPDRITVGE